MTEWMSDISIGIIHALNVWVFLAALIGVIIGTLIGVLPGLGPPVAISLAIPLTFGFDPLIGMSVMLGIYKGGTYGGSISAILINTPGTPAASATVLDGYPLAQQGKAGKALDIALYASVFGDAFSILLLCVIAQPIAAVASKFGPIELFSLLLFAMTVIAGLAGKSMVKGLIGAGFGLALSLIGLDPVEGLPRFTYGIDSLEAGLNAIPIIVGLFAIAEQMQQVAERARVNECMEEEPKSLDPGDDHATWKDVKSVLPIFFSGSLIGASIGALPGTGAAAAAFMNYGLAKKRSKNPELFGKGSLEGVAAAESANNAVCGGALVPMLTLGIPGDVVTAILMGALMLHGINTGPSVFVEHRAFVFTLFGMLLVSVFMLLFVGKIACNACRRLACLPNYYIFPVVLLLCVAGSYALSFSMFDVWVMLAFGVLGFFLNYMGIPLPPFIIAFILAPKMEQSLRQGLIISGGDLSVLITHPLSAFFLILTVFTIIKIVLGARKKTSTI
ncbi:tripartite tricarboxylate transporter permease [Desulfovibrio litoralis]|uniref:Putative tricarboxylic transport membrane protein n=1 Tax=Desulfovibrio litoralis DSM 11393 TaxID=1121455 RepID=A0A1M7SMY5_9BACT|nr:tripartite tricarboxylate transporter permease [Desulfovibrio litoralis]SHN59793.1 putative tricarboxylic transport membrane protein [Desulfovibrio litoralis DSM 11393]